MDSSFVGMVAQAHSLYVDVDAIRVDALDNGGASEARRTKPLHQHRKIAHMSLKPSVLKVLSHFAHCENLQCHLQIVVIQFVIA